IVSHQRTSSLGPLRLPGLRAVGASVAAAASGLGGDALRARGFCAVVFAASALAGSPAPVSAGFSVTLGVLPAGLALTGALAISSALSGVGAPGASGRAFSSPGITYSAPSQGERKSKVRKSWARLTGS